MAQESGNWIVIGLQATGIIVFTHMPWRTMFHKLYDIGNTTFESTGKEADGIVQKGP